MIRFSLLSLIAFSLFITGSACLAKEPTVPPALYKKLQKIEELIGQKAYGQAEQKLLAIHSTVDQGSFSECVVLRSLSSVYSLKSNYKKSADYLSRCLKLKVLPENQQQQGTGTLGQLYMAMEQYKKAIDTLGPWIQSGTTVTPDIYALMANAHTQLKQYRQALPYIDKAIAASKKPSETWYQLKLALYYQLENYSQAAVLLKKLIQLYPDKKEYWMQLSTVYQQLKDFNKASTIKHLAYNKGYINTENELLQLVNLLIYVGNPHKAARILQVEIKRNRIKSNAKNWELLANAWTQAQEFDNAVKALETASTLNSNGRLYQQLGQIFVEQEQWGQAIKALNQALNKGGLKRTGATYILLGMSYFESKQTQKAQQAFSKAKQYKESQKTALQWLQYIADDQNYKPS